MELTIQELAERAGVTERTIRYYVAEGLLPPPMYGKPARYTDEHLDRLLLIKSMQEKSYMPLSAIKSTLDGLDHEQVRALLAASEDASDNARGYLLDHKGFRREEPYSQAEEPEKQIARRAKKAEGEGSTPGASAMDYISKLLHGQGSVLRQARPSARQPTPPPPPPAASAAAAPMPASPTAGTRAYSPLPAAPARPPEVPSDSNSMGGLADSGAEEAGTPTPWLRLTLAPGVELHYSSAADAGSPRLIERIVRAVLAVLREEGGGSSAGDD